MGNGKSEVKENTETDYKKEQVMLSDTYCKINDTFSHAIFAKQKQIRYSCPVQSNEGEKGLKDNNKSRLKQEQDHHPPRMIRKQEHIGR